MAVIKTKCLFELSKQNQNVNSHPCNFYLPLSLVRKKSSGLESAATIRTKVFVWGLNDKDQLGGLKGSKVQFATSLKFSACSHGCIYLPGHRSMKSDDGL